MSETLDQFEAAHLYLMQDAAQEESLGRLYLSRAPSTDEMVLNFISLARALPTSEYPSALRAELKFKGSGELLERLDEAVSAFEQRARQQAHWAHQLQNITILIAALVLVFEAAFIFLPAHRVVRRAIGDLKRAAETDPLTQLRNRAGFDHDLANEIETFSDRQRALSLILFDLDDFKGINDRYGHLTGDAVLRRVGHRVSRLPNLLSAARVGGDEFAILVDNKHWSAQDSVAKVAADIATARDFIYRPINVSGRAIKVSGSVGVSRYPIDAQTVGDLRRNASASLLDAKRTGRGSLSVFNNRIKDRINRRRTIQSALLSGAYRETLKVVFQPMVDAQTNKIRSAEALARWRHQSLGDVNPIEFLDIARESGIGQSIERQLRSMALEQIRPALDQGLINSVSLNVSPLDLAADDFVDSLIEQIEESGVRPDQVWIEITETEKLRNMEATRINLDTVKRTGVRIALDDYGIGYSNIHRLAELPIDRVKIDKSIVQKVDAHTKYAGVCRSSVQLAHALGADVVAEGVETADQLAETVAYGCHLVQGYYFHKPMPVTELETLLSNQQTAAA